MSAHTIVTHTQTRGTIGRVSGRKVSTSPPKRIEVSGRNRPSDRKKQKTNFKKHFRLCGNLLWGHANLLWIVPILKLPVQTSPQYLHAKTKRN